MGGNITVVYSVSEVVREYNCTVYLKDGRKFNCTVQCIERWREGIQLYCKRVSERWEEIELYCIVLSVSVRWREYNCIVMYSVSERWERIGGK